MGVYAKDNCSIPVGKKLGCIFVENHNLESILLKKGQTIGLVTSCLVMQEVQSQTPVERSDATKVLQRRIMTQKAI